MNNKLIKPWAHGICREAVRCVGICEKDPRYDIDMGNWHQPRFGGGCNVCAAGAWMAVSLNIPADKDMRPHLLSGDAKVIALAMSELQFGEIKIPLELLGQEEYYRNTIIERDVKYGYYRETFGVGGPKKWRKKLLKLADYLEDNFLGENKELAVQEESVQKVEA